MKYIYIIAFTDIYISEREQCIINKIYKFMYPRPPIFILVDTNEAQ